jgi:hypothetical protein
MTSLRQLEANRRNARLSTGPVTEEGKKRSRRNAVRHGLTAETVIDALEDGEDYAGFEMAITADFDAQSAVARELVLRLASLLWRLRRATAIETGLFEIQARQLLQFRQRRHDLQAKPIGAWAAIAAGLAAVFASRTDRCPAPRVYFQFHFLFPAIRLPSLRTNGALCTKPRGPGDPMWEVRRPHENLMCGER